MVIRHVVGQVLAWMLHFIHWEALVSPQHQKGGAGLGNVSYVKKRHVHVEVRTRLRTAVSAKSGILMCMHGNRLFCPWCFADDERKRPPARCILGSASWHVSGERMGTRAITP